MSDKLIPRVGLGALIFNDDNQLLLGQRIASHGLSTWAPPGGHLEFGESFEEGIMREVLEETGLVIQKPLFVAVTNDYFEADKKHYISVFMKSSFPADQKVENCEPHKTSEWCWSDMDKLPESLFLPLRQVIDGFHYGSTL